MRSGCSAQGVTVGQAAAFAGVTVKTVRHYHRLGLLDEPLRDSSGYRRYGSTELLRLIQARTLAVAGVPLAQIRDLLDADAEQFTAALDDVGRRLTAQIETLIARRDTLHQLGDVDRALLPDRARAILDRIADLGWPPEAVSTYREDMVLARALLAKDFDTYLAQMEDRIVNDPELATLYRRCWTAAQWNPDDPRVDDLATAVAEHLLSHPHLLQIPADLHTDSDGSTRYGLINHHRHGETPTWARLTALIETRLRAAGVAVPHQ